jgi:hypothetical protein
MGDKHDTTQAGLFDFHGGRSYFSPLSGETFMSTAESPAYKLVSLGE